MATHQTPEEEQIQYLYGAEVVDKYEIVDGNNTTYFIEVRFSGNNHDIVVSQSQYEDIKIGYNVDVEDGEVTRVDRGGGCSSMVFLLGFVTVCVTLSQVTRL